jgi:hypothetical protein
LIIGSENITTSDRCPAVDFGLKDVNVVEAPILLKIKIPTIKNARITLIILPPRKIMQYVIFKIIYGMERK